MSIESESPVPSFKNSDMRNCNFLVHEEEIPLYEWTARQLNELGLGEFSILRAEQQIDDCKKPLNIPGIVRVQESGSGDWLQFWKVTEGVQYHLKQNRAEVIRNVFESEIEPLIEEVINHGADSLQEVRSVIFTQDNTSK
jgi:hypothetical protein